MGSYVIDTIIHTEKDSFEGLDKTHFTTGGATVYLFHRPGNAPNAGDTLDGTIAYDRRQNMKFTKTKTGQYTPNEVPPTRLAPPKPQLPIIGELPPIPEPEAATRQVDKVYKADPDKMKQEYTLEQARNMSIQRQVAAKGAIDLVIAGRASDIVKTYTDLMTLLSEPDWRRFLAHDDEPPFSYSPDQIPTDEEVLSSVNDLENQLFNVLEKDDKPL